jgi:hypothetical protein
MRRRKWLSLLVTVYAGAAGAATPPVYFSIDPSFEYATPNMGLIGAWIDSAGNKRTRNQAERLRQALPFDLMAQAMPALTCAPGEACATRPMATLDRDALKSQLAAEGQTEAIVVRYFGMVNDDRYWSRLVVARVQVNKDALEFSDIATAYYVSMLPDEERKAKGAAWGQGTPTRIEQEVRTSWAELRGQWDQIATDTANGRKSDEAWSSHPKVQKEQDGWQFRCRGISGCSGQRIVKMTPDRVWLSFPQKGVWAAKVFSPALVSMNREAAAFAANVAAVVFQ